ncbi:MAG: NHL repeat-containing protein [Desulfobulbaceae bacterium]|nr:NHL repeat-containing protein [Desulfobulbaceae bacterium]
MLYRKWLLVLPLIFLAVLTGYYLFHPEDWIPAIKQNVVAEETIAEKSAKILQEQVDALKVYPRYQYSIRSDRSPQALAASNGKLYVSYQRLNLVDILDYDGTRLEYFDPYPKGPINIVSLATDFWNNLYIVDARNRAILVFDSEQSFQGFFPPKRFSSAEVNSLMAPSAIAINRNNIFVSDIGSSMAKAFLLSGDFVLAIPGTGKTERKPWHPIGISVTGDGRVLVSDLKNKNISVFNCIGNFAHFFAEPEGEYQLQSPGGMAIDGDERVHVIDTGSQKVFVYDSYGRFLFTYGATGNGSLNLQSPMGIAIDKEKKLVFIADTGNHKIDVWSLKK